MTISSYVNLLREMRTITGMILGNLPPSAAEREDVCRRTVQLIYAALASAMPEDYKEPQPQGETK